MNEIEVIDTGLIIPHTPKECKEFLIKAKPVLQAIKAQIKLIEDVEDLENLRDDLKEKGRYIAEMILDAEVKIGEYALSLPKDRSFKGNQWQSPSAGTLPKSINQNKLTIPNVGTSKREIFEGSIFNTSGDPNKLVDEVISNINSLELKNKTKREAIYELGFSKSEVNRFETLAKNKDLVEQVKQEARENNINPTRTQVLSLAKARKQMQEQKEEEYKEFCINSEKGKKLFNQLVDSLGFIRRLKSEDIELSMMSLDNNLSKDIIGYIQEAQVKLALLKQEAEKYKGVKIWEDNEC